MQFSVLGCGAVDGFMVRGNPADPERTIARATAAGVNDRRHGGAVRQW
jgi:L-galactose dehydrogenase/L-glyceraldehyde 3-phosphate reductase